MSPIYWTSTEDFMRWVMMLQMATSVLFLIFIIPALISLFSTDTN